MRSRICATNRSPRRSSRCCRRRGRWVARSRASRWHASRFAVSTTRRRTTAADHAGRASRRRAAAGQRPGRRAARHARSQRPHRRDAVQSAGKPEGRRSATTPRRRFANTRCPLQGPLDTAPSDTTFAVYESGRELTYLPDPLAVEVACGSSIIRTSRTPQIIRIPLYAAGVWPDARPFVIERLRRCPRRALRTTRRRIDCACRCRRAIEQGCACRCGWRPTT